MPTIPGKVTYKNGAVKDVIFYYTGTQVQYDSYTEQNITTGYWSYFENGEVTKNADGTYTGTGDRITLTGNTYDNDDIPMYDKGAHRIAPSILNKYESVEIFGEKVEFDVYVMGQFLPTGTKIIYENGEPVGYEEGELIPYFTDGTKVKNVILTYENNSQQIFNIEEYKKMIPIFETNPKYQENMLEGISQNFLEIMGLIEQPTIIGFDSSGDIGALWAHGTDYIYNKLSTLSKITIEEEINGKLEKKTFDVFNTLSYGN